MTDSYQKIYRQGIFQLARSFVVKSVATAMAMNNKILRESVVTGQTVLLEQPQTWRYYLHLAGEYHPLDTPMTVISLDTTLEIPFTKAALVDHRLTLRTYRRGGSFYNELLAKYPEQVLLIKGILNPVPLSVSIAAQDHTILAWDRTLVEPQEDDLILRVQGYMQRYLARWYDSDQVFAHNCYPAAVYGELFSHVPAWIETVRQENVRTNRAHSYHIWNYLDGFGNFSVHRRALTTEQALWLYRNMQWLRTNGGKEHTFQTLVEHLLTKRNIPLGQHYVKQLTEGLEDNLYPELQLDRLALNRIDENPYTDRIRSLEEIVELQIPYARDNDKDVAEEKVNVRHDLERTRLASLPTKVLESVMVDNTNRKPYALSDVLLDHWIFLSTYQRYGAVITVRNPNNGDLIRMSVKEAAVWYVYAMNRVNGFEILEQEIQPYEVNFVRRRVPPTTSELQSMSSRLTDADIQETLSDLIPIEFVVSTEAFYFLCGEIHQRMLLHHRQFTREERHVKRGQLEETTNRCYRKATCVFVDTPTTFEEFFTSRGWNLHLLNDSDIQLTLEETIRLATGADVNSELTLAELQKSLLAVTAALSAYSNQFIPTINSSSAIALEVLRARIDNIQSVVSGESMLHQADITPLSVRCRTYSVVKTDVGRASTLRLGMTYTPHRLRAETQLQLQPQTRVGTRYRLALSESRILRVRDNT